MDIEDIRAAAAVESRAEVPSLSCARNDRHAGQSRYSSTMRIRGVRSTVAITVLAASGATLGATGAHAARPADRATVSSSVARASTWKIVAKHRWKGPDEEGVEGRVHHPTAIRVYTYTTKTAATVNWDNNCGNKKGAKDKHGTYHVKPHVKSFHTLPIGVTMVEECLVQTTSYLDTKSLFGHPKGSILQEIQRR